MHECVCGCMRVHACVRTFVNTDITFIFGNTKNNSFFSPRAPITCQVLVIDSFFLCFLSITVTRLMTIMLFYSKAKRQVSSNVSFLFFILFSSFSSFLTGMTSNVVSWLKLDFYNFFAFFVFLFSLLLPFRVYFPQIENN